jgi:hypothetical protein
LRGRAALRSAEFVDVDTSVGRNGGREDIAVYCSGASSGSSAHQRVLRTVNAQRYATSGAPISRLWRM